MDDETTDPKELWPETRERMARLMALYGCSASELINRAVLVLDYAQTVDAYPGDEGVIIIKIDERGNITAQQGIILDSK